MKLSGWIFLASFIAQAHAAAAADPASASSTATSDFATVGTARSEIKIDKKRSEECSEYVNFVETFSRFTLFKYDWQQKKYYLIRQDFALGQGCFEGYNPQKITVTANELNPNSGAVATKAAWHFNAEGAVGGIADYPFAGLYKVDMPGCCAATPVAKYYSLQSGKFIMASTIRPLMLDLTAQRSQRYIGADDHTAAARWGNAENIATIFLGNSSDNLQMVAVHSSDADFNQEEWMVTQLNFAGKNADEQAFGVFKDSDMSGLALQLVLTCRCERPAFSIEVPLEANRIDIAHAKISGAAGIALDNFVPRPAASPAAAAH